MKRTSFRAPSLLAITPESAARDPDQGRDWFAGLLKGLEQARMPDSEVLVQLRDKLATAQEISALLSAFKQASCGRALRWSLNQQVDLACLFGFDGVHLVAGQEPPQPRSLAFGFSSHSVEELTAAPPNASYALFGPIFDTPSKRRYGAPLGVENLRRACAAARSMGLPLLAIGGVNSFNISEVLEAGASGVAVIRSAGCATEVNELCAALLERRIETS